MIEQLKKDSMAFKSIAKAIDEVIAGYAIVAPYLAAIEKPPLQIDAVQSKVGEYANLTQGDAAFQVLSKNNKKSMSRDEIYDKAVQGGARIPSSDNLSPVLSRDKRFKQQGRGLWILAEWDNNPTA